MIPLPTISLADWKHEKLRARADEDLLDLFEEDWLWSRAHYEALFPLHGSAGDWEFVFINWRSSED